ncbi:MAG: hypothetical protein AMJ70_08565 [Dehalococcoidia bacterium SG8_51_3]|nr:MAG: hypothetical protein AMJ70_08565 [Dehalococcoidia bacterium SG8_51_3]
MWNILAGIFLVLHGLVHLLCFGHGMRFFTLKEGLNWPDGSWLFVNLFGNEATRMIAAIACVIAAVGFVTGAVGLFASQSWWNSVIIASAAFSTLIFVLFWDGVAAALADKGLFAILINAAIMVSVLVLKWPHVG